MSNPGMTNPDMVQEMVRRRVRRRRLWRRARKVTLVITVSAAVAAGAFGIDRMVVALQKYYATSPHAARATGDASSTVPSTTAVSGPPTCVSGQLSGAVTNWQGINATMYETVSLTNISLSPCTLLGYPVLAVNSANGTALPAATQNVATMGSSTGGSAAGPTAVVITPEMRAWFELSYPDNCSQILTPGAAPTASANANTCYEGKWLQITPPKTTSPLLVLEPLRFTYGTAGFNVGPFGAGSPPPLPRS
jgi:hypothetical protein